MQFNGVNLPYNRDNNNTNINNANPINNNKTKKSKNTLKDQFFKELDEFQFKNKDKFQDALTDDNECSICLGKYKITDKIKELPCRHIFHKKCIKNWLERSDKCPLCQFDIQNEINKRKEELERHIYEEENDLND